MNEIKSNFEGNMAHAKRIKNSHGSYRDQVSGAIIVNVSEVVSNILLKGPNGLFAHSIGVGRAREIYKMAEALSVSRAKVRAELFETIIDMLQIQGPEKTLDWIQSRGHFEIMDHGGYKNVQKNNN